MCIDSYADISIHTPTRGTTAGTGTATNLAEFQSTFPREERPYYTIVRIQVLQFQSTLPREERPFPTDFVTAFMPYFNPRSHERSDFTGDYTFEVTLISIHAPTRGATEIPDEQSSYYENISIHAPTRGATMVAILNQKILVFQSTLPREERRSRHFCQLLLYQFQSTLPREERRLLSFSKFDRASISIHAPTRGATKLFVAVKVWYPIFQSTLPRDCLLYTSPSPRD